MFSFCFGAGKMSRARAKKILQSVQSLNSQYSEVTHDNITNPDSVLFQSKGKDTRRHQTPDTKCIHRMSVCVHRRDT